jgi:NitT/TauT family transport system ATP-binding protein
MAIDGGRTASERDGPSLLALSDVTLRYKTPERLVTAAYRVSFEVDDGDRFVLLGASGCGKSSLLKAIGGFLEPASGTIRLRGQPIQGPGADRVMVFQDFEQLMPWKTVYQNVLFPMTATGKFPKREAGERALAAIDRVKLTQFKDVFPHMLSGGMKMRVALARALALEPDILLMDEPFAALDALTRREMQEELLRLWQHLTFTVIFVTHSIEEAMIVGSRILILSAHPGRVRAEVGVDKFDYSFADGEEFGALSKRIHNLLFEPVDGVLLAEAV